MRCVYCSTGRLRPTHLTHAFTFGRQVYPLVDPDGLLCDECGEAFISRRAAAVLALAGHTQRLQAIPGVRWASGAAAC
jgi:hypothetical protein